MLLILVFALAVKNILAEKNTLKSFCYWVIHIGLENILEVDNEKPRKKRPVTKFLVHKVYITFFG